METVDIIGLLVPVTYFIFLITERLWPARNSRHGAAGNGSASASC